mgnify:CR=1 FL=1
MTSVKFENMLGVEEIMSEVYKIPDGVSGDFISMNAGVGDKFSPFLEIEAPNEGAFPHEVMYEHEKRMVSELEAKQFKVLSVKSERISKRRYKRRIAKELKKLAKRM